MERPLEEFLRLNSTWGLPSPAFRTGFPKPAFTDPAPVMPATPPMPMPTLYGGGAPPVVEEAPPAATAPAAMPGGFTPAPFELPSKQFEREKNADVFGAYTERLGIRAPQAQLTPLQQMMQPPAEEPAPRYLQAQPQQQGMPEQKPGAGPTEGQAKPRRQPQQWQESPALARRYPGATRMRQLVDKAREKRGYV